MLALGLWLLGHGEPLQVMAEAEGLRTARSLLTLFRPEEWPGFCPPLYREVALANESVVLDLPDLLIIASPTEHVIPGIALKIVDKSSGRAAVYSSDTAPCESVVRLARGVDVLIHEASGEYLGHSSAAQAGQVAQRAGAGQLYLIHYSALTANLSTLVDEAQREFAGPVELARDFGAIEL
jgi:ribonuclease Z